MALNIIGLSAFFHDSACCLLRDGCLVAAAEEERFSRRKHDPSLPWRAVRYCLKEAGLTLADIAAIAYYEQPAKKLARQLWMGLQPGASEALRAHVRASLDPGRAERAIRNGLGFSGRLEFADHHLSHAASSFFFSGFQEAAVLTVDAVGEWATTTYGRGGGDCLDLFEEVRFPHSLGLFYSALTAYLGFDVNSDEYKVMGLAPYGRPRYADQVRSLLSLEPGGQIRLNLDAFDFLAGDRMFSDRLPELFGKPPREPESEILPFHQDLARSLQAVLEEILLEQVRWLHGKCPSENLCLAGGVALNCVANGRVLRDGPFRRLFVQPAAGDAGGALGAAAVAHLRLAGQRPDPRPLPHALWGPAFSPAGILRLLQAGSAAFEDFSGREQALLDAAARRLAGGQVLGWFHGRMEFGPRALGARSILADPRGPAMRQRINDLVKKREAFRPFAPAVLEGKAAAHFCLDHPSPFMLETCQVRSPLDLPAITHVDGSARVQTVSPSVSPRFHGLLEAFDRRTGCPILLNTSFNMRGEPIVCTPADAIRCFVRSAIDALVLEDFIVDRSAIPALWQLAAGADAGPAASAIRHDVYTLF